MGKPMSTVYVPDEYGRLVPTQVPTWIGFIGLYAGPEPPEGYLYCDGSAIGRETYSELFEAVGTLYGAGDGVSTFELPDARGVFFRGDGGEAAAMGVIQGDAIRNIAGKLCVRPLDTPENVLPRNILSNFNNQSALYVTEQEGYGHYVASVGSPSYPEHPGQYIELSASRTVPTAPENRPINMAFKPCIRYV